MFKGLHGVLAAIAIAALVAWAGTKPSLIAPASTGRDSVPQQLRRPNDASATAVSVADDDGALETNGTTAVVGEFVVASATTNAVHDFSMPTNAVVCERWLRRGAARDWLCITNDLTWAFPFGTSVVRRLTVSSTGAVLLHADSRPATNANERVLRELFDPRSDIPADCVLLAPLRARLGVVPLLNWNLAEGLESRFWTSSTSSNTLLLTWQNVLLDRLLEKSVSFQVELTPSGRFRFAYDLVSLAGTDLSTTVLAGAFCGDCRATVDPPPGVVSVFDFHVENPVDTDGDGLNDGWERAHGFDPLVDNAADGDPTNDYGYDRDDDGLTNGEECEWGTNPRSDDTDSDGVTDKDEIENGSDPTDPDDGGIPASRVPVSFTFGDPSGSHSEKYRLVLEPVPESGTGETPPAKSWLNENYGECETKTAMLTKGWTYEIRLSHVGSNIEDGSPDYDYLLSWSVPSCCGCVTNDPSGLIREDYTSDSFAGEGKVARILVLDGGIWADYNRTDGIDGSDRSKAYRGRPLRHWYNDDDDEGDTNEGRGDIPAAGSTPDCANNRVDGRCDVLDFTPVWIDMGAALDKIAEQLGKNCALTLAQEDGAVNLVWTSLTKDAVATFLKTSVGNCGSSLAADLAAADTVRLTDRELELPENFINLMRSDRNKGVVLIEGRSPDGDSASNSVAPIVLRVYEKPYASDSTPLCELRLPLSLSSVERMYDVSNIRGACGDSTQIPGTFGGNLSEDNGTTVFFLHGFNVSANDSRAWFSEMFKRLRQAGSHARFCGVGWSGDYNLVGGTFNAMHYHRDVYNALQSATAFADLVNGTSGNKIVIAHSLGNMVASKAIGDGLVVGKYFMLDAAIPSEAFDATLQDETAAVRRKYVPSAWRGYDPLSWAANWHRWFPEDDRGKLRWRGVFSDVPDRTDVYNYYSDGDEVFEEQGEVPTKYSRIFHWPTFKTSWPFVETGGMLTPATSAWQKQEVLKGVDLLVGTLDGGWGFHCWTETAPGSPPRSLIRRYTADEANAMVQDGSVKTHPVFDHGESAMFGATISESDINRILAYNIPAISSATGRTLISWDKTSIESLSLNTSKFKTSEWGRNHPIYEGRWLHSDVKNMTFQCVYRLFEDIIAKGALK